jgi:hypothetical protein
LLDLGNTAALADAVRTTTATLDTRIVHLVGLRGLTVAATHRLRIEGCSGPVLLVVEGDVTLDGRLDIEAGCGEIAADRWPPTWAPASSCTEEDSRASRLAGRPALDPAGPGAACDA